MPNIIKALFVKGVVIPPTETTRPVTYDAGTWYDNVPPAHIEAAGSKAVVLTMAVCGHLLTPDGRAVYSDSEWREVHTANGPELAEVIVTRVVPHKDD